MLITEGTVSNSIDDNNTVTEHPFFFSSATNGISINDFNNKCEIKEEHKQFLHPELLKLYEKIGYNKEYLFKSYTFLTLNELIKRKGTYENLYDIALTYLGLGHILVISYHPKSERFFFRMDGGSNGYDREANYNKYKNCDINTINNEENPTRYEYDTLYTFEEVISIINLHQENL
jgi:hypothetical protein